MIVDSSALVALIMAEASAAAVFRALDESGGCAIGAPSLVETAMVLARRRADAARAEADLMRVVARMELAVIPFGHEHWEAAWAAFLRYGKGRHPAALNYGDCLTYAVAKMSGLPLLCIGGDFEKTDLELVPLPG